MARRKQQQQTFIKGTAKHSRTESDYMSALLEAVILAARKSANYKYQFHEIMGRTEAYEKL